MIVKAVERYPDNKDILRTYCDVGILFFAKANDPTIYDDALGKLREAESNVGDPDIPALVAYYERQFSSQEYS